MTTAHAVLPTEFQFTLPHGLPGEDGELQRSGRMRLATARDEIEPLRDPAVRRNDAYLAVLLLARTVLRIGIAWMTEMLVYRINRVPEKLHVAFLDLLGLRLDPPSAASTQLRFLLAAPAARAHVLAAGPRTAPARRRSPVPAAAASA